MIRMLQDQNSKLKGQSAALSDKNKQMAEQLERKTREVAMLKKAAAVKKTVTASKENAIPAPPSIDIKPGATNFQMKATMTPARPVTAPTPATMAATDSNLLEVARKLKARCAPLSDSS
jgi:hypothetical protein